MHFFMPAIVAISRMLNYSVIEIHNATLWIIQKGYYLLAISTDSPLTLCLPQL